MKALRVAQYIAFVLLLTLTAAAEAIPGGAPITVRLNSTLSSGANHAGDVFDATLTRDLVVSGKTIAHAGTPARGKVTYVKPSGRLHHPGVLTLRLTSVNGQTVQTSAVSRQGKSHTKSNATKIGGGAAAGTVLGAVFGGGKGAAIGAGAGAAAGTGLAAATGKQEAVFAAESALTFISR